jgi:hypothetical protein
VTFTVPRIVGAVCGLMLAVVVLQAVLPQPDPPAAPPAEPPKNCVGDAIPVDYAFGGWMEPHECAVQCTDDKPRYILYSDGKAAQCETPPGCNDEGEDRGILCIPSVKSE